MFPIIRFSAAVSIDFSSTRLFIIIFTQAREVSFNMPQMSSQGDCQSKFCCSTLSDVDVDGLDFGSLKFQSIGF